MADGIVIGSLRILLGMDATDLDRGAAGAEKSLQGLSARSVALGTVMGNLATDVLKAAWALGKDLTTASFEAIDAQSKLAGMLGGTVTGMQALTRAADLSDISQQSLAKNAAGLNARLVEVGRTGEGPVHDALKRLGLDAEELLNLDIDERFAAIGQAISDTGMSSAQTADALRDLGIKGSDFIDLLATGGGNIRDARQEVERFGIAVSDIDGASIENANDAISRIGLVAQGVGNKIAVELAPYVEGIADALVDAGAAGGGFGDQVTAAVEAVIGVVGVVADGIHTTQREFKGLELVGVGVAAAIEGAYLNLVETINGAVRSMRDGYNSFAELLHLPTVVASDTGLNSWVNNQRRVVDQASGNLARVKGEMDQLSNGPKPSEQMAAWVEDVKAKSAEAAAATVAARKQITGTDLGDGETDAEAKAREKAAKEGKALQDKLDGQLESLRGSLTATEASETASYEKRLQQLVDFHDRGMVTDAEYAEMSQTMAQDHQDKLSDIETKAQAYRNRLQTASISRVTDTMGAISSALQAGGEDQFGIIKGLAIATALLKGYEAVMSSYAAGTAIGGPPVGFAFAALAAATTAAQLSQIMSTTSSSSGSPTMAGSSGSSEAAAATQPGQTLYIQGLDRGSLFSGDSVRELVSSLIDYQKDGGTIVLANT